MLQFGSLSLSIIFSFKEPKPTDTVQVESNLSLLASQFGFDISTTKSHSSTLDHSTNFDDSSSHELSTEAKKTEGELKAKFFTSDLSRSVALLFVNQFLISKS